MKKLIAVTSAAFAVVLSRLAVSGAAPRTGLTDPQIIHVSTSFQAQHDGTGNSTLTSTLKWTKVEGATVYEVCDYEPQLNTGACDTEIAGPPQTKEGIYPSKTTLTYVVVACESSAPSALCAQSTSVDVLTPECEESGCA